MNDTLTYTMSNITTSIKSNPQIKSTFMHKTAGLVNINWYDLSGSLPDLPWQQVYVIGNIDGKVPIVHYADEGNDNLPGGKTEPGETIDDTITREILEELNCEVISWQPLGYQECIEQNGKIIYQLRVVAKLRPFGEFKNDPGGSVIGYSLVLLNELNMYIQYGEIGDNLVKLVETLHYEHFVFNT